MTRRSTLLETAFPFVDVCRVVAADRRSPDPAYQAHRWWARRPAALLRAVLLAASMPAATHTEDFWATYRDPEANVGDLSVFDPFMGGGTTLVEGSRLGATVYGQDVDPMSVELNRHQLNPADPDAVQLVGDELIRHLEGSIGHLWPVRTDDGQAWEPLHYFTLARVTCPACAHEDLLYRTLVIARSIGKAGAVVRDHAVTAFCPTCRKLHSLKPGAKTLTCCGKRHRIASGTFSKARYNCPRCGQASSHEDLATGAAPRILVAVEETPSRGRRRIRAALPGDEPIVPRLRHPSLDAKIEVPESDRRPVSLGITTVRQLHTSRQIAYMVGALRWIGKQVKDEQVARALRLAVSTSLTSNNRLCGYATDYGRLAPLFSVRAFALPALAVELNPLSSNGGRGSLRAALARVVDSCGDSVRRHVIGPEGAVVANAMALPRSGSGSAIAADSTKPMGDGARASICVTDPPYFDYINYDTFSQVFRAWLTDGRLAGEPVLPGGTDPAAQFGTLLGSALSVARQRTAPDGVTVFTFRGSEEAWRAVAVGLERARLRVTALWPVLTDPAMGHHSGAGNCEFDLLVVTRDGQRCDQSSCPVSVDAWIEVLETVRAVGPCDRKSFEVAVSMLGDLWAEPRSRVSQFDFASEEGDGLALAAEILCERLQHPACAENL